jgi:catechol 2,3-dioxygenase-like lactoylglutathione lyase family enzyme
MELNTARVFVKDIVAARQFYSTKLGLPLQADGSQYGYCVFKAGR